MNPLHARNPDEALYQTICKTTAMVRPSLLTVLLAGSGVAGALAFVCPAWLAQGTSDMALHTNERSTRLLATASDVSLVQVAAKKNAWEADAVPEAWAVSILSTRMLGPYNPPPPPRPDRPTENREPEPRPEPTPPAPTDPDRQHKLVGLMTIGGKSVALVANLSTGVTTKVTIGEDYASGSFTQSDNRTLTYTVDGEERQIALGQLLTGESGSGMAMASRPSSPSSTTSSGSTAAPTSSGGSMDSESRNAILERLRARRAGQ